VHVLASCAEGCYTKLTAPKSKGKKKSKKETGHGADASMLSMLEHVAPTRLIRARRLFETKIEAAIAATLAAAASHHGRASLTSTSSSPCLDATPRVVYLVMCFALFEYITSTSTISSIASASGDSADHRDVTPTHGGLLLADAVFDRACRLFRTGLDACGRGDGDDGGDRGDGAAPQPHDPPRDALGSGLGFLAWPTRPLSSAFAANLMGREPSVSPASSRSPSPSSPETRTGIGVGAGYSAMERVRMFDAHAHAHAASPLAVAIERCQRARIELHLIHRHVAAHAAPARLLRCALRKGLADSPCEPGLLNWGRRWGQGSGTLLSSTHRILRTLSQRVAWDGGPTAIEWWTLVAAELPLLSRPLSEAAVHDWTANRAVVEAGGQLRELRAAIRLDAASISRLRRLFEMMLDHRHAVAYRTPLLWRLYIRLQLSSRGVTLGPGGGGGDGGGGDDEVGEGDEGDGASGGGGLGGTQLRALAFASAKRIFLRAVHACPWCKELWLDGLRASVLRPAFSLAELSDLVRLMTEKGIHLRGDPSMASAV
jgi:hypothetical protein